MPGPTLASLILASASALVAAGPTDPAAADAAGPKPVARRVADARRALADRHPVLAVGELESALGDPGLAAAEKPAVLGLLRQSYDLAAEQADAAGRPLDADSYRENARILARKAATAAPAPPAIRPDTARVAPVAAPESSPAPPSAAPPIAIEEAPVDLPGMPAPTAPVPAVAPEPWPARAAEPEPAVAPQPTGPGLAEADAAFRAGAEADTAARAGKAEARPAIRKSYAEAGRIYAALAQQGMLPEDRRAHWAYCRSVEVARRISAQPRTEGEWQQVDAEIEQIRVLAPDNWLGNYLRNKASSRPSARKVARPGNPIVRAASPEEPPAKPTPAMPSATRGVEPVPTLASADRPANSSPGTSPIGRWQIRESANFRVFHANSAALAEQAVQAAEAVRRDQTRRWSGSLPAAPWQPKCEIYLYPSADQYAKMTGQPADSPGFSTMGMNEGVIISRRVNLRVDHDGLLGAVLPHEVTHVILADFFPEQQIPRWADEGMAVLTEPAAEQKRRAADLVEPLTKNLLFTMSDLMNMDYPDNAYWSLYYAQSVSLTRFLVEQGTPAQFIQFLQGAQRRGVESELRQTYKIDGFADLQARWVAYARAHLDDDPAASATASNTPKRETRSR